MLVELHHRHAEGHKPSSFSPPLLRRENPIHGSSWLTIHSRAKSHISQVAYYLRIRLGMTVGSKEDRATQDLKVQQNSPGDPTDWIFIPLKIWRPTASHSSPLMWSISMARQLSEKGTPELPSRLAKFRLYNRPVAKIPIPEDTDIMKLKRDKAAGNPAATGACQMDTPKTPRVGGQAHIVAIGDYDISFQDLSNVAHAKLSKLQRHVVGAGMQRQRHSETALPAAILQSGRRTLSRGQASQWRTTTLRIPEHGEASKTVEESSDTADDEMRLLARKRKLEEAQLAINMKKLKYLENQEQELLRLKEDTKSLAQLQEIEGMVEALCEAHLSYKPATKCCELAIH
ncbi:MAG: hypothetical protein J3Q66DRAFT_406981 [Benniella sp.]|nr:MAG: hypothetical protein J3Q66DRAFT_406981 [Benniella sp.]